MSRVIKALGMRLHPEATCRDCDWTYPTSPIARVQAKAHAARGHAVEVVMAVVDVYRLDKPAEPKAVSP